MNCCMLYTRACILEKTCPKFPDPNGYFPKPSLSAILASRDVELEPPLSWTGARRHGNTATALSGSFPRFRVTGPSSYVRQFTGQIASEGKTSRRRGKMRNRHPGLKVATYLGRYLEMSNGPFIL